MGIEFKLTDRELPVSPVFVSFLAQVLSKRPFEGEIWADQRSEALLAWDEGLSRRASEAASMVMADPRGREWVMRTYERLVAIMTGNPEPLLELQSRFHFIGIIGIARTGGSYLTAELYRALGMEPTQIPSALAHDSFPDAGPFVLQPGLNSWLLTLKTVAEYLTMVEIFFKDHERRDGKVVVPKKLTKGVYAGGVFRQILGEDLELVVTLRHPVAACVSTYEKSGGLPADGAFSVRSNIEGWCRRDLECNGSDAQRRSSMDYFDAYLRYWEQYHLLFATSGLAWSSSLRVVPFDQDALSSLAQSYHDRYGSGLRASEFHISNKARLRHPDWIERARPAIDRVAAVWSSVGLHFPTAKISACW
jgi:hypothetical protein